MSDAEVKRKREVRRWDAAELLWLHCIPAELTGRQGGPPTTYLYCKSVQGPQKKGKAVYLKSRLKTKKCEAKEPNLVEAHPSPARVTKLLLFCLLLLFCVKISNLPNNDGAPPPSWCNLNDTHPSLQPHP